MLTHPCCLIISQSCGCSTMQKYSPRSRGLDQTSEWWRNVISVTLTMVVGARQAGLSCLEAADLLGFLCTPVSRVYAEWLQKTTNIQRATAVEGRGQRRMARVLQTLYNHGKVVKHLRAQNTKNLVTDVPAKWFSQLSNSSLGQLHCPSMHVCGWLVR